MVRSARKWLRWFNARSLRVATKFAIAFMPVALAGALCIAGIFAFTEARRLRATELADLRAQGLSLVSVLNEVALVEGDARMRAAVALAARAAAGVRIQLLASTESPDNPPSDIRVEVSVVGASDTYRLVLSRPPEPLLDLFLEAVGVALGIAMAMGVFATLIAYFLGEALVGTPLRRMVEHARRIAAGDLRPCEDVESSLEIVMLHHELNAMCASLIEARAKAESEAAARIEAVSRLRHAERLSTVGTLAAGLAHELGTPLNVVYLQSKVLERAAADRPSIAEGAKTIRAQAERMTALVKTVLGFARRKQPELEDGDLAIAAQEAVALLSPLARARGLTLELDASEAPCRYARAEIQQVIVNLVVNACDALRESESPIRVRVGMTEKAIAGETTKRFAFVSVEDAGTGIDEESLKHIFEPFFTTKDVGEGTGLGLSVVYGIVQDHGGILDVKSSVGVGTNITVYLPALVSPQAESGARPANRDPACFV